MTIPAYLVISQWVLLFTLAILVILMFRQLGRHLILAKRPSSLGPEVGSQASSIVYSQMSDGLTASFVPGRGRPALIGFVDPTCPACEELVTALNESHGAGELSTIDSLLLTTDPPSYLQISEPFRATRLPIGRMLDDTAVSEYRASATPLLVAIDATGIVRASGPVTRRSDIHAFIAACLVPPPEQAQALSVDVVHEPHRHHHIVTTGQHEER